MSQKASKSPKAGETHRGDAPSQPQEEPALPMLHLRLPASTPRDNTFLVLTTPSKSFAKAALGNHCAVSANRKRNSHDPDHLRGCCGDDRVFLRFPSYHDGRVWLHQPEDRSYPMSANLWCLSTAGTGSPSSLRLTQQGTRVVDREQKAEPDKFLSSTGGKLRPQGQI